MAQCFRCGWRRCSPLNWALVANEKNAAKTKYLGLRSVCFWLGFRISTSSYLGLQNRVLVSFVVDSIFQKLVYMLKVSSVTLFVQRRFFVVVNPFSTALCVPSGFSDRRFETTPDLSFSKHVKTVLAKRQSTSNQSFRFGN